MRTRTLVLIPLAMAGLAAAQQQAPARRTEPVRRALPLSVPGRLVVQHRLGADEQEILRSFSRHGAVVHRHQSDLRLSVLTVDAARRDEIQKSLEQSGLFNFVEPDYYAQVDATPNDPSYGLQWHLPAINAPAAWNLTTGQTTVPVAMIDSGADATHPDLAPNLIAGFNFLNSTTNTSDTMGHGTTTAGTVAAAGNNGIGVSGVEWTSSIMPLVVVDSSGYATYSNIANAITYAANHGVRIINISIGGTTASSTLQSAVTYAWNMGSVVFASAGNGGVNAPYYPAGCQNAVAVGATDQNNNLASFSNYGTFLAVVAPGVNVYTTSEGGGYTYGSGTSYSSPIAAGVAALMLSYSPSLSASALVSKLEQTATDLGAAGFDPDFGWGLVNAGNALSSLAASPAPPTVSISSPAQGATVSGTISVQGTASATGGLSSIEFYVDNVLAGSTTASPFSFNWNTTTVSNASHTLTVKATDTLNNAAQASTTVAVSNSVPGTTSTLAVAITSPANNATVGNGTLTITTSATDNVAVTQVSIYVDNVLYYTGSVAPYTVSLSGRKLSVGAHTIIAKAWDVTNSSATSAAVTFTALK